MTAGALPPESAPAGDDRVLQNRAASWLRWWQYESLRHDGLWPVRRPRPVIPTQDNPYRLLFDLMDRLGWLDEDGNLVPVEEEHGAAAAEAEKLQELAGLLIECRDALPAIRKHQLRTHNISPTLADRMDRALEPWEVPDDTPGAI